MFSYDKMNLDLILAECSLQAMFNCNCIAPLLGKEEFHKFVEKIKIDNNNKKITIEKNHYSY